MEDIETGGEKSESDAALHVPAIVEVGPHAGNVVRVE